MEIEQVGSSNLKDSVWSASSLPPCPKWHPRSRMMNDGVLLHSSPPGFLVRSPGFPSELPPPGLPPPGEGQLMLLERRAHALCSLSHQGTLTATSGPGTFLKAQTHLNLECLLRTSEPPKDCLGLARIQKVCYILEIYPSTLICSMYHQFL